MDRSGRRNGCTKCSGPAAKTGAWLPRPARIGQLGTGFRPQPCVFRDGRITHCPALPAPWYVRSWAPRLETAFRDPLMSFARPGKGWVVCNIRRPHLQDRPLWQAAAEPKFLLVATLCIARALLGRFLPRLGPFASRGRPLSFLGPLSPTSPARSRSPVRPRTPPLPGSTRQAGATGSVPRGSWMPGSSPGMTAADALLKRKRRLPQATAASSLSGSPQLIPS